MELLGVGWRKYDIPELKPGEPYRLLKVTPDWFVCHTTIHLDRLIFSSGGKATVSVFVCPAGFTPSSWLTMLTSANWDTMDGWMMDRMSVDDAGTHKSFPCSSKLGYQLGPDDAVVIATQGSLPLTDLTLHFKLPTYKEILSDVTSLSAYQPRPSAQQVSYEYSTKKAAERHPKEMKKIHKWLETAPQSDINRVLEMVWERDSDSE